MRVAVLAEGMADEVTEATWINGLQKNRDPYSTRSLKHAVYGVEMPHPQLRHQRCIEEAKRLCAIIPRLEQDFPMGFGLLARDIWSG